MANSMLRKFVNSRRKGAAGERELAAKLRGLFPGLPVRRGQQYSGVGGADVVGLAGVHVECKRTARLHLYPALGQARRDAKDGAVPVVMWRGNGADWVAVVALDDLIDLASAVISAVTHSQPDSRGQRAQGWNA